MCHHYRLLTKGSELSDAVSAHVSQSQMSLPFGDFYPLSQVPVMIRMKLGLRLSAHKGAAQSDAQKKHNVRKETMPILVPKARLW